MKSFAIKLALVGTVVAATAAMLAGSASAHVVVKPSEVVTAGFNSFTMGVPNEKDNPTVKLKLVIPEGLQYTTPNQKDGWKITVEKDGKGDDATTKSITWSGGEVRVGMRDAFIFSAKVPEKAGDLQWKAYQTYADGSVVAWDQSGDKADKSHEGKDKGPFSVTKVVEQTDQQVAINKADQAAADAKSAASRSLYVAVAGLIVALIAVFLSTRTR